MLEQFKGIIDYEATPSPLYDRTEVYLHEGSEGIRSYEEGRELARAAALADEVSRIERATRKPLSPEVMAVVEVGTSIATMRRDELGLAA